MSSTLPALLLTLLPLLIHNVASYQVDNNPFKRAQMLDLTEGKYFLEWEVVWAEEKVIFKVIVETHNWVGFGLSNDKKAGSSVDLVVGGVRSDGSHYFGDYHTTVDSTTAPILDGKQDWKFSSGQSNGSHTFLTFSRLFDTCDPEGDAVIITLSKICLNWAYGKDNNEEGKNVDRRGIHCLYLLDADYAPRFNRDNRGNPIVMPGGSNEHIPSNAKFWTVDIRRELPADPTGTSYLCTMHKAPALGSQHHMIGYAVSLLNENSTKHIHHMVMLRCHAPVEGVSELLFEPFLKQPPQVCYIFDASHALPMAFCNEMYLGWGIGGKDFFLPNDVGFPFGGPEPEYFVFQMHYDNPARETGIQVGIRFDFYYIPSSSNRVEGALIGILGDVPGPPEYILLPPRSINHTIYGHCSPECTRRIFKESVTIVVTALHSHNAGTSLVLHHFRPETRTELPWILYDRQYDNRIQTLRPLRNRVVLQPGDQITINCNYSTAGTAVGGFATNQEMCMAFLIYIKRGPRYSTCTSGIYSEMDRRKFLGVGKCTWKREYLEWVVDEPEELRGLKISQVSDTKVTWTAGKRADLQRYQKEHAQVGQCHKDIYERMGDLDLLDLLALLLLGLADLIFPYFPPFGVPSLLPELVANGDDDFVGPVSYPVSFTRWMPPSKSCSKTD